MIKQRISSFIKDSDLLDKASKHLVALSGGADSVCLLLVLKQLGYVIEAVHCNFHLRGEESDRDEEFCRELCALHGVPFHVVHFDTTTYAELHKVSIEMAARELRYDYFEKLRQDISAEDICVAHHKDDNVETVLINLVRGTGLNGLIGIRPKNGRIIRPLLCIGRSEIVDFLDSIGQNYVTDSTNLVDDVVRNKIRLNIIPQLQDINPSVTDNIARMTTWMIEVEKITVSSVNNALENIVSQESRANGETLLRISLESLKQAVSSQYVLFSLLHPYGFSTSQILEVAGGEHKIGSMWTSLTHTLVVDRDCMLLGKTPEEDGACHRIPETGNYVLGKIRLSVSIKEVTEDFEISRDPFIATLDADKIHFPLTLRRIREGDRFVPFGMRGSKLVSDYLTDRKCDYFVRKGQFVVCDGNGEIIWLIGQRTDMRYCVEKKTINGMILRFIDNE